MSAEQCQVSRRNDRLKIKRILGALVVVTVADLKFWRICLVNIPVGMVEMESRNTTCAKPRQHQSPVETLPGANVSQGCVHCGETKGDNCQVVFRLCCSRGSEVTEVGSQVDWQYPPAKKITSARKLPEESFSGPLRQFCVINYPKELPEIYIFESYVNFA